MSDSPGIEFPVRGFLTNSRGELLSTEPLDQGVLIRWGFEILSVQDTWLQRVVLPPHWKIRGYGYHHYVIDEHGRTRISYFEKNAAWDQDLFGSCNKRFRAVVMPLHGVWADRRVCLVPAILDGGIPIWMGKRPPRNTAYKNILATAEQQLESMGWGKLSLIEQWELPIMPFVKITPAIERYFGVRIKFCAKALLIARRQLSNLKDKYHWLPEGEDIEVYSFAGEQRSPLFVCQSRGSGHKAIVSNQITSEANVKRSVASYERRRDLIVSRIEQLTCIKERLLKGRSKAGQCFDNLDCQD